MLKPERYIGQRFGRLIVTGISANRPKYGGVRFLCLCDCGGTSAPEAGAVRRTDRPTISCGCFRRELQRDLHKIDYGRAERNRVVRCIKDGASARGYEFSIDDDQVVKLISSPCHYCGAPPSVKRASARKLKREGYNGRFPCNGIDRVDNSIGYAESNCVPCCRTCNLAKHAMSKPEFISWLRRAFEHTKGMV